MDDALAEELTHLERKDRLLESPLWANARRHSSPVSGRNSEGIFLSCRLAGYLQTLSQKILGRVQFDIVEIR